MILARLQEIASQDSVSGVAVRCLDLLDHADDEVSRWAAECLSGSVAPREQESPELVEFLAVAIERSRTNLTAKAHRCLADQLYWGVTLIGRLGTQGLADSEGLADPESFYRILDKVIELAKWIGENEKDIYAEAIKRAGRVRSRFG